MFKTAAIMMVALGASSPTTVPLEFNSIEACQRSAAAATTEGRYKTDKKGTAFTFICIPHLK